LGGDSNARGWCKKEIPQERSRRATEVSVVAPAPVGDRIIFAHASCRVGDGALEKALTLQGIEQWIKSPGATRRAPGLQRLAQGPAIDRTVQRTLKHERSEERPHTARL